jgi:type VI protein secretion system component VasF
MLLKGVLIGAGSCVVLVGVFAYLLNRHLHAITPAWPASWEPRYLATQALSFYSGLGIGFIAIMVLAIGVTYALWHHIQHVARG